MSDLSDCCLACEVMLNDFSPSALHGERSCQAEDQSQFAVTYE
jgi:hypothetical protein